MLWHSVTQLRCQYTWRVIRAYQSFSGSLLFLELIVYGLQKLKQRLNSSGGNVKMQLILSRT